VVGNNDGNKKPSLIEVSEYFPVSEFISFVLSRPSLCADQLNIYIYILEFIAKKICTTCSRTNNKIFPLLN
jgi:hypothetical protein